MEKINALIDKLQELKNSQANLQTISYYSQLLQAEILHQRNILQRERDLISGAHGHVAVILPAQAAVAEPVVIDEKPVAAPPAEHQAYLPPVQPQMIQPAAPPPPTERVIETPAASYSEPRRENGYHPDRVPVAKARPAEEPKRPTLFDMPEKPHSNGDHSENLRKDINELVNKTSNGSANGNGNTYGNGSTSLNDQLRQSNVELGQRLGEMGVQDLKNAIGINDRFRFIEELFRGEKKHVRTLYQNNQRMHFVNRGQ